MILIQVPKINFLIPSIMADLFSPIIGAGATLASALFGSNNSDKSLAGSYRAPKGQSVAWKDGRLAIFDPSTGTYKDFMDNFGVDKIPKSVYWSLMTNQANQYFSERMWNAQNEYNTPLAQADRLRQAGINPYLAMQNDGNVGQAQSANIPSGAPDMTSGNVAASLAASRNSLIGSVGNVIQSAFANLNQQKIVDAQAQKAKSEAKYQDIMNLFAYADMYTKVQKQMAETKDVDSRRKYQDILNFISENTKEYQMENIHSQSVKAFNDIQLQADEHNLNVANLRSRKLEAALMEANLSWLPKEKAAGIAQAYAQAYAATASAKAAQAAAENYAADTYGKRFDNKMRDDLHSVILNSEKSRYKSQSVTLDILKQELEKAKKDNNTYMIRMIGDLIGQIAGAAGSVGVGYGAVSKALKN